MNRIACKYAIKFFCKAFQQVIIMDVVFDVINKLGIRSKAIANLSIF